jgi:ribosomal protein S30
MYCFAHRHFSRAKVQYLEHGPRTHNSRECKVRFVRSNSGLRVLFQTPKDCMLSELMQKHGDEMHPRLRNTLGPQDNLCNIYKLIFILN